MSAPARPPAGGAPVPSGKVAQGVSPGTAPRLRGRSAARSRSTAAQRQESGTRSGIRILADDLTGALDTAAAFAGEVPVYIDRPPAGVEAAAPPVAVVATPTRDVAAAALPGFLAPAVEWFRSGSLSFKKVDSLLRGNTFAEIAWLFRNAGFARVVFAPAFPAQGRITVGGRQWIIRSGLGREAVAVPLQKALSRLGLRSAQAFEAFGAFGAFRNGVHIWIPEVAEDHDLDQVVRQADTGGDGMMWVGSAGLGNALARRFGLAPDAAPTAPLAAGAGPSVLVSASFQPVFREQWARLRANRPAPAVAEAGDAAGIAAAIAQARAGAGEAWFDLSPRASIRPEEALRRLEANARRLVEELPVPGRLIVVGGDTLLGLCRAAGAAGLTARASLRPGWGCARLMGGAWDGVPCYSRSGAFGAADDLVALVGALEQPTSC